MAHETYDVETGEDKSVQGQPGCFRLLPFTVAADLVSSPFQIGFYLYSMMPALPRQPFINVPIVLM